MALGTTEAPYLHLVHTLLRVPMQESLALEHGRELVADTLEQLLDRCRVAEERDRHLVATGRNVALCRQHVVRDPLHEVRRVLVLHVLHLLLNLLHRDLATEDGSDLVLVGSESDYCSCSGRITLNLRSGSDHDEGQTPPSCSSHRTSAASARERSQRDTAGFHERSRVRIRP